VLGDAQARRDGQLGGCPPAEQLDAVLQRLQLVEDAPRPAGHELARRREHRPAPTALDQGQPEPPFERAHPLARGGLAHAQLGRGRRQAAPLADQHEQPERLDVGQD
jgi:hypothetical protein